MTFLTSTPDLSGTIFAEDNLLGARKYLSTQLAQEYPAWLRKPRGPLGDYWRKDDAYAACTLIDFATTLFHVAQNITERSYPLLATKIREGLLNAKTEKQFLENYTEFQVASVIINFASPLALDPMVSAEDLLRSGHRPPTPDFAIRLPDGDVGLEVTVCYVDILDQWDKSVDLLSSKIEQALVFTHDRSLHVTIQLPLKHTLDDNLITELQREIYVNEWGSFQICHRGVVKWEPVPHNPVADLAFFVHRDIVPPSEEENELISSSFRNTFDRKRKQFSHPVPAILVLRLGHHRIATSDVIAILRQRIWPNDKVYDWISGICLFTPRQGFGLSDPGHHLELCTNHNAQFKVSDSLLALFNGTAQYHLRV